MGKIYDVKVELVRKTKEQFESDRIALAATPDEGEDIGALIADMKAAILGQMTKNLTGSSITEKVELKKTSNGKQAGTPISDEKPLKNQEKEDGKHSSDSSTSESSEKASSKETGKQETSSEKSDSKKSGEEASSKETSKEKVTEKTTTKVKSKKTVQYDRELATHKDMLGAFLDEKVGKKWRSGDLLSKAAKTSAALHKEGTPFLDGEGNILESFTTEFLKRFEA
jgi:hypothetical protein